MPEPPKRRAQHGTRPARQAEPAPVEPLPAVEEAIAAAEIPALDPASVSVEADRERRLTRAVAAQILGVSITTLRRAEQTGEIPHSTDVHGVKRFSRAELLAYGARLIPAPQRVSEGERHAKAFSHFDRGGSPQSLVVAQSIAFPEAEKLYRDWASGAPLVFSADQVAEVESLGIQPRAAAIIEAVRRLRDRLRQERAARDHPRSPAR